jgi:hypothetical protein
VGLFVGVTTDHKQESSRLHRLGLKAVVLLFVGVGVGMWASAMGWTLVFAMCFLLVAGCVATVWYALIGRARLQITQSGSRRDDAGPSPSDS